MKKCIFYTGIALLFATSCNKEIDNQVINNESLVSVTVHVTGFSVSQEDFPTTRAAESVASYANVNAITLAFYNDSTQVYKATQLKTDSTTFTTFGKFNLNLPTGSYTMVAIAHTTKETSPFVLTSPTLAAYTGEHSYETFVKTQTVDITTTAASVDVTAVPERIVSQLMVKSTDEKTAGVTNVRMTFSAGSWSFNPTTGLATSNTGCANKVGSSGAVGTQTTSRAYLFLASDEQTMDVTIETLGASGNVIFSTIVHNVPFKRNRVTVLTGKLYSSVSLMGSFQIETEWLPDYNGTF